MSFRVIDRADLHATGVLPRIPLLTHCQLDCTGMEGPRYGDGDLPMIVDSSVYISRFTTFGMLKVYAFEISHQLGRGSTCEEIPNYSYLCCDRLPVRTEMLFLFEFGKRGPRP